MSFLKKAPFTLATAEDSKKWKHKHPHWVSILGLMVIASAPHASSIWEELEQSPLSTLVRTVMDTLSLSIRPITGKAPLGISSPSHLLSAQPVLGFFVFFCLC